jgi:RNA polymerase-interacting CarD/CdnL/TRCF family regulator
MFKVKDKVVHLSHGIGEVTAIEERQWGDKVSKFYVVTIDDNGAPKD